MISQGALASLERVNKPKLKPKAKPRKLTVKRKVGNAKSFGDFSRWKPIASRALSGVPIDQEHLEKLGDLVADYLSAEGSGKETDGRQCQRHILQNDEARSKKERQSK